MLSLQALTKLSFLSGFCIIRCSMLGTGRAETAQVEGVVLKHDSIYFLSNSANISSWSSSCPFCVCAKKPLVFTHSPGSVNGKQTKWLGPSYTLFQPTNNVASGALKGRCI